MNVEDTIVAVSSPPGVGARGIVRLSGPSAIEICNELFDDDGGRGLQDVGSPAQVDGRIRIGRTHIPASVVIFGKPRSYTRQDVTEFHLLGAPSLLGILTEACIACGARRAEAGEFTVRAYLAGALDLTQVHGIAGMIAARSDLQLQAAERLLHGALAAIADKARDELADLLSLVEGALDFADEPIEFITAEDLKARLHIVRDTLRQTELAGLRAERWGQLPRVSLVGPPNAGKSSLLNRLTGVERAICAPIAGTTRDVLSAPLNLGDSECLLVDAAGLEEAGDEIGTLALSAARRAIGNADLLLQVLDVSTPRPPALSGRAGVKSIVVGNKLDTLPRDELDQVRQGLASLGAGPVCLTSAATSEGCDALKNEIGRALRSCPARADDAAIALMAEHRASLQDAIDATDRAVQLASRNQENLEDGELLATELRSAADSLAMLVGKDQVEDLLGRIFSRFCVGK